MAACQTSVGVLLRQGQGFHGLRQTPQVFSTKAEVKMPPDECLSGRLQNSYDYFGIPKRFIGGTIYDTKLDEVVIGAEVNLQNEDDGISISRKTDDFGDFWVYGLSPGKYLVTIKNNGYIDKELKADITEKDINLGDIALDKK